MSERDASPDRVFFDELVYLHLMSKKKKYLLLLWSMYDILQCQDLLIKVVSFIGINILNQEPR